MVRHFGIKLRLDIFASIRDRSVGRVQLDVLDAFGQAAQCHRLLDIRIHFAVNGFLVHNRREAELLQILVAELRRDIRQRLDRDNVHRVHDRGPDRGIASVRFAVPVAHRRPVGIIVWFVFVDGRKCFAAGVKCRRVSRNNLERGSRLPERCGRAVERSARGLGSAPSDNREHIAGFLIFNCQRNLRLRGERHLIRFELSALCEHRLLVLLCHLFCRVLIAEQKARADTVFLHPGEHHLRRIIARRTVIVRDAQLIIQIPAGPVRIIGLIVRLFVRDLLDFLILRRIDIQAAGVQKDLRLRVRIPRDVDKIRKQLVRQRVDEIRIDTRRARAVVLADSRVNVIRHRLVILRLRDPVLVQHVVQHYFSSLLVRFRIDNRIVPGRILRNSRQNSTLRKRQITDRLSEIRLRSRLHAQRIVPEVDDIQIIDHDIILGHAPFQLYGKVLLLELADHGLLLRFLREIRENTVLDQLLGNRGRALRKVACRYSFPARAYNADDIHAVMLVESGILDRDKCVLQILRNHIQRNRNAVGIGGDELRGLFALIVIDKSRVPGRRNVDLGDVRRVFQNTGVQTDSEIPARDKKQQKNSKENLPHDTRKEASSFLRTAAFLLPRPAAALCSLRISAASVCPAAAAAALPDHRRIVKVVIINAAAGVTGIPVAVIIRGFIRVRVFAIVCSAVLLRVSGFIQTPVRIRISATICSAVLTGISVLIQTPVLTGIPVIISSVVSAFIRAFGISVVFVPSSAQMFTSDQVL